MTTSIALARYLIYLAGQETEPEFLTHMRVQKLLYYAQGWSLAIRQNPIFDSIIEAWRHGPVVRDVYDCFKSYESKPIPPDEGMDSDDLSAEDRDFARSIWASYKNYSAAGLRAMTHKEAPWVSARNCLPEEASSNQEISQSEMKEFFRDQYHSQKSRHGITIDMIIEAERDASEGRTMSMDEALARLGHGL